MERASDASEEPLLSIPPGWQALPIDTFVIPTQFERGRRY
jgi:hypothetical protein